MGIDVYIEHMSVAVSSCRHACNRTPRKGCCRRCPRHQITIGPGRQTSGTRVAHPEIIHMLVHVYILHVRTPTRIDQIAETTAGSHLWPTCRRREILAVER